MYGHNELNQIRLSLHVMTVAEESLKGVLRRREGDKI